MYASDQAQWVRFQQSRAHACGMCLGSPCLTCGGDEGALCLSQPLCWESGIRYVATPPAVTPKPGRVRDVRQHG